MTQNTHDGIFAALIGLVSGFGVTWIREFYDHMRERAARDRRALSFGVQAHALVEEVRRLARKAREGDASAELWTTFTQRSLDFSFSASAAEYLDENRLAFLIRLSSELQVALQKLRAAPPEHLTGDRARTLKPIGAHIESLTEEILASWTL